MSTHGLPWVVACAALGVAWLAAVCAPAERGRGSTALRGLLGGLAALGVASSAYGVAQLAGVEIRWEWLTGSAWTAFAAAAAIGLIEEGAKLTGLALAVSPPRAGHRRSNVLRTSVGMAAVFAVFEAALALPGASWPLALSRAALGPVAHALLAAPFAVVLAEAGGVSRARLAARAGTMLVVAAALHGFGDWSVARPGWGQAGFGAALLAPAVWLYLRARRERRRGVPTRGVAQIGGRLRSPYPVSST